MVALFKKTAESNWFQYTITGVILLAGVVVGLETFKSVTDQYGDSLHVLNDIILIIFIIEIIVKMIGDMPRPWNYFKDPWNIFDFIIVAASFIPNGGEYATILRLARLLRVLRLVRAVPRLQILVGALLKSIPSMGYVAILLGLMFYIYAVAGVFMFSENDPVHFKDLPTAMLSLFRVVTLEDWTDVMYIQMYGCADYGGYNGEIFDKQCVNSQAMPILGAAYFVSFVLLGTMIFLNLFVGVILNGMEEAQAEQEEEVRQKLRGDGPATLEDEMYTLEEQLGKIQEQMSRINRKIKEEHKDQYN